MSAQDCETSSTDQRGAALLSILVLVFLVAGSVTLHRLNSANVEAEREMATQTALKQAKEALIAFAAISGNPGRLPCPEDTSLLGSPNEGSQLSSCTALPAIGRLPWRTLKLDQIVDGYGEPLWYALSPGFRSAPINTSTTGQLTIDAQPTGYAAIVFSAGQPLSIQLRSAVSASSPPLVSNYLDETNNNGDVFFASTSSTINDRLLGISAAEITAPIVRRVLAEVRGADTDTPPSYGLRRYFNDNGSSFPFADTDNDGSGNAGATTGGLPYNDLAGVMEATANGWITSNGWYNLITYKTTTSPVRATLTLGGYSLTVQPCTTQPCP